jgi:TRAP-type C4-dicarboxylate transport system substrate-binding protein
MVEINWLIAHEPQHLFLRTAQAFSQRLFELTQQQIKINILTTQEYQQRHCPEFDERTDLLPHLIANRITMSQTQTHRTGNSNFRVFDMPFLFRDHDHATTVLEGPIGAAMCENLSRTTGIRGLAFTYSGGFRVIGSNEPITSAQDLLDKRVRVNLNPVNSDFITAIGGDPNPMYSYGYDEIEAGELDAAETTYIRFLGKYVFKTEHNMFLTAILINNEFWSGLDPKLQAAFQQTATEVARLERQWSVEDAEQFEQQCKQNGVTITFITEQDKAKLKSASQFIYDKWEPMFAPGLVKSIQNLH